MKRILLCLSLSLSVAACGGEEEKDVGWVCTCADTPPGDPLPQASECLPPDYTPTDAAQVLCGHCGDIACMCDVVEGQTCD